MSTLMKTLAFTWCVAGGIESAMAAVVLTARDSHLNAEYLFGAAADVTSDNVTDTSNSLTERFSMFIADSDADAGVVLGQPWSAAITYSAGHAFEIFGSPLDLAGISSSGNSAATATYTGGASIGVNIRAPGNSWSAEFDVTAPIRYILQGGVGDTGTRNTSAGISLQRFVGVWVPFVVLFDQPNFYETGELTPGQYRVIANASAVAGLNVPSAQSDWHLQLTFVPIPSVAWLFAGGVGSLILRGTKRNSQMNAVSSLSTERHA